MIFPIFHGIIRKLNPRLRIDCDREINCHNSGFPVAGLYYDNTYLFAVPHNYVPELSIYGLDFYHLKLLGYPVADFDGTTGKFFDHEFTSRVEAENPGTLEQHSRFLTRGYRAIATELIRRGYVDMEAAEKAFGFHYEPNRTELPRRYIDLTYGKNKCQ